MKELTKKLGRRKNLPDFPANSRGIALIMTLIFLAVLALMAGAAVLQSSTGLKVSTGLRNYEIAFNLADGACDISTRCIADLIFEPQNAVNWDPQEKFKLSSGLPDYIDINNTFTNTGASSSILEPHQKGKGYKPEVYWVGYETDPVPGWEINYHGYSGFYQKQYKARGGGRVQFVRGWSQSHVFALLVKVTK